MERVLKQWIYTNCYDIWDPPFSIPQIETNVPSPILWKIDIGNPYQVKYMNFALRKSYLLASLYGRFGKKGTIEYSNENQILCLRVGMFLGKTLEKLYMVGTI